MNEVGSSATLLDFAELVEESFANQSSEITEAIAVEHARQGNFHRAVEIAETIADPYSKDQAFGLIASVSIDARSADDASEILNSIEDPMVFEIEAERVAIRYAVHGQIEQALEVAFKLSVSDPVLSGVAVVAAEQGLLTQARDVAASIESTAVRASTLGQIALNILGSSPNDVTEEIINEMKTAIDSIEFDDERIDPIVSLGALYETKGEKESALKAFEDAHSLIRETTAAGDDSNVVKDVALGQIVIGFGQLRALDQADQVLGEIEDPFHFAASAIALATLYDRDDHLTQIEDLLAQAREIGNEEGQYSENGSRQRDSLFVELTKAFASLGRFDQAIEVASAIASPDQQLNALSSAGERAAKAGAESTWTQAAECLENGQAKVTYWLSMNEAFLRVKNDEGSKLAIDEAIAHAKSATNPYDKHVAFSDIGVRLASIGQTEKAASILSESVSMIPLIDSPYFKVRALINLAQKYWTIKHELTPAEREALSLMVSQLE